MPSGVAELRGLRILVVEDEYFIAEDIADNLRDRGVDVLGPCGNIEQAVRLLATGDSIDAAVLDVNLHDGMVYTLANALRRRGVPSCSPPAAIVATYRRNTPTCRCVRSRSTGARWPGRSSN